MHLWPFDIRCLYLELFILFFTLMWNRQVFSNIRFKWHCPSRIYSVGQLFNCMTHFLSYPESVHKVKPSSLNLMSPLLQKIERNKTKPLILWVFFLFFFELLFHCPIKFNYYFRMFWENVSHKNAENEILYNCCLHIVFYIKSISSRGPIFGFT